MRQKVSDLRLFFASTILNVRSGRALSRTDLAQALGISASTVGIYVDQLIASGHLDESGLDHGSMGRPKRLLRVRSSPGWFAGVEFNASRLHITGLDFAGKPLGSKEIRLNEGQDAGGVAELVSEVLARQVDREGRKLLGIGIGAPGIVNSVQGLCIRYSFIPGWENIPLGAVLEQRFQVPVAVENNLRVIALAERWFGSHREENDYVIVGPRNGFGLACVQSGRLVQGAHHAAGEIGLWPWPLAGSATPQEMHRMLSAPRIYRRLAELPESAPVPEDLPEAVAALRHVRGPQRDAVVEDIARVLGCVQLILDPVIFLLHGPLAGLGNEFCQEVMEAAKGIFPALHEVSFKLECTRLADDAGALGAASLAMEAWMPD